MAYAADFEYDIFISYAWADNQPYGDGKGWVDHFEDQLKAVLTQEFGKDSITIFRDVKQSPNTRFDKNIPEALGKSALFLALISPQFLESEWCLKEIINYTGFMDAGVYGTEVSGHKGRFFTILLKDIHHTRWPEQLHNTNPFIFFTGEKEKSLTLHWDEGKYYYEIQKLIKAIKSTLDAHNLAAGKKLFPQTASGQGKITLFLADVPEKLQYEKKNLIKSLDQPQIILLDKIPPPEDFEGHNGGIKKNLPCADLSIHLLSDVPGREFIDRDGLYYPIRQAEMIKDMNINQLILLPESLEKTTGIRDEWYKKWIDDFKIACNMSETSHISYFTSDNVNSLVAQKIDELTVCNEDDGLILIRTDKEDQQYAHDLAGWLIKEKKKETEIISPRLGKGGGFFINTTEYECPIRQIVILYGRVSLEWVNINLEILKKQLMNLHQGRAHTELWLYLLPPEKESFPVHFISFLSLCGVKILDNSMKSDIDPAIAAMLVDSSSGGAE